MNCCCQCYDGASNMSGAHNRVTKLINQEESRAIYMHCYGLALNLAVGDCLKSSNIYKDTLDTSFEITRLKCEANQKQHASRQVRSKALISAEAKKLATLSKKLLTS